MSHLVQFMSLFGGKILSVQPWKCHSKTCATLSHIWATTSKVVFLKNVLFLEMRYNFWFFFFLFFQLLQSKNRSKRWGAAQKWKVPSALCNCGISASEDAYGGCISEPDGLQLRVQTSGRQVAPWAKQELTQTLQPVCPKSHSSVICQRIQSRKHIKVESPEQLCFTRRPLKRLHINIFIESLANCRWILNKMTANARVINPPYDWLLLHLQELICLTWLSKCASWSVRFHLSTILFLSLDRDLCAPISGATMCHGSWDISQTWAWIQNHGCLWRHVRACLLIPPADLLMLRVISCS